MHQTWAQLNFWTQCLPLNWVPGLICLLQTAVPTCAAAVQDTDSYEVSQPDYPKAAMAELKQAWTEQTPIVDRSWCNSQCSRPMTVNLSTLWSRLFHIIARSQSAFQLFGSSFLCLGQIGAGDHTLLETEKTCFSKQQASFCLCPSFHYLELSLRRFSQAPEYVLEQVLVPVNKDFLLIVFRPVLRGEEEVILRQQRRPCSRVLSAAYVQGNKLRGIWLLRHDYRVNCIDRQRHLFPVVGRSPRFSIIWEQCHTKEEATVISVDTTGVPPGPRAMHNYRCIITVPTIMLVEQINNTILPRPALSLIKFNNFLSDHKKKLAVYWW